MFDFWNFLTAGIKACSWKRMVFDSNPKIKVLKTCFWIYHCVGKNEINPLVKLRRRTDMPERGDIRIAHAHRHAIRDPHSFTRNWTGFTRHVMNQHNHSVVICHTTWPISNNYARLCHVIKGGPDLLTWTIHHQRRTIHWVLIQYDIYSFI